MADSSNSETVQARIETLAREAEAFVQNVQGLVEKVMSILQSGCPPAQADKSYNEALAFLGRPLPDLSGATGTGEGTAASLGALSTGPPKSVVVEESFTVEAPGDEERPEVSSMAVLPGGLIVVGDMYNGCLKVFNRQGRYLHQSKSKSCPSVCWLEGSKVAVVHLHENKLDVLSITPTSTTVEASHSTENTYRSVAKLSPISLLAGGSCRPRGLDVLSMTGQILRSIETEYTPNHMCPTLRGSIICINIDGHIFEVDPANGEVISEQQVPPAPADLDLCSSDGSFLHVDHQTQSLSVLAPDGRHATRRELWAAPAGGLCDDEDGMGFVMVDGDTCVCGSQHGKVYVMRLCY